MPPSHSSGSTRSCWSTASAAPITSRSCCCSGSPRSRWRSSAGRPEERRGGTRCGRLRRPRRRVQAVGGSARADRGPRLPPAPARPGGCGRRRRAGAGVVGLVYGGHLPATGIQDGLVGPLSVPNVLAALAGHGGMTAHDRAIAHVVLALAAVGATAAVAWRRAWLPGAAGFVMLATVRPWAGRCPGTCGGCCPSRPSRARARSRARAWCSRRGSRSAPFRRCRGHPRRRLLPHAHGRGLANHVYTQRYLQ